MNGTEQPKKEKRLSRKKAFLAAFAECGNITQAAEMVPMSRTLHYTWMENDSAYPELFAAAEKQAADRLEQEARRRAVEGVDEPVFYQGMPVGVVRKYSDTLLIFLMKGAMPEKYKERTQNEITGEGGAPVNVIFNVPRPPKDETSS